MAVRQRFKGLMSYTRSHWPTFFLIYGALILALFLLGVGLLFDLYSFIPFAVAIAIIAGYALAYFLWIGHQLYDIDDETPADILIRLSQIQTYEQVACIDLGLRDTGTAIAKHLITGRCVVIDVYNPQSHPSSTLRRARSQTIKTIPDPRLTWIDGNFELLSLPDNSVAAVFLVEIFSEFWLPEERKQLLDEVWRILIPEGRLLLAERVQTQRNLFLSGLLTSSKPTISTLRSMLEKAGFILQKEESRHNILYCVRAFKPSPSAGKQMTLSLEYV
jgi:ubiquinone/menaquinone biosynthesis C-methylase UbiE